MSLSTKKWAPLSAAAVAAVAGAVCLLAGCGGGGGNSGVNPVVCDTCNTGGKPIDTTGSGGKPVDSTVTPPPAKQKYTLSVSANPTGSASFIPMPGLTVDSGDTITVTVRPSVPGKYTFLGWEGASASKDSVVKIRMLKNETLTAKFLEKFAVTATANPAEGGTINRTPDYSWYSADSGIVLRALPNQGYTFNGWSGDTTLAADKAMFSHRISRDVTFVANFQKRPRVLVEIVVDGVETPEAGSVTLTPPGPYYEKGDSVSVTPVNNNGFIFGGWLDSAGTFINSDTPYIIIIDDSDVALKAEFMRWQ